MYYIVLIGGLLYFSYNYIKQKNSKALKWKTEQYDKFNFKQQSIEIDSAEHIRVNNTKSNRANEIYEECSTPFKALVLGMQRSKNGKCFGWREGASPYKWMNYQEAIDKIKCAGSALRQLIPLQKYKLNPKEPVVVGFYTANMPQCTIMQYGCVCYGYTILPFYDAYGVESIKTMIKLANVSIVLTDSEKRIESLLKHIEAEKFDFLKTIIYTTKTLKDETKSLAKKNDINLIHFDELLKIGTENFVQPDLNSSDDSIYAIVPTSGTTGEPKAAILSHKCVMFFAASYYATTEAMGAVFNENDIFFSYLPNAHVFDLSSMVSLMSRGMAIGYSRGDPKLLVEDMQELKPTMVPMVARMLQKIHDKVINQIKQKGKIFEVLLKMAIQSKIREREQGIIRTDSIWDTLLFNKIRALTGGRIRIICCGATPFPKDIMQFTRAVFSCYIFEGYGQTESTSATSVSHPVDPNYEHVGAPVHCLESKLVDVPEMGYFSKENKGELCIRGPTIFSGYYKNEERTKEAIDEKGWLHTGDIGMWLPNGALKIIDRRKQIFKLSQGEYIAPEKIENILKRSEFIDQAYVDGNSLQSYIVAVIVLDPEFITIWAKKKGLENNMSELCKNKDLKKEILQSIEKTSRESKLNGYEIVRNIFVSDEAFSVENGLLTPTQKVKRVAIKNRYKDIIESLYADKAFAPSN